MKKVIKEFLFFILFLSVILLMIGSLLYEYIPNQVISGVTKYEQSSGTKKILSQIQTENSVDIEEDDEKEANIQKEDVESKDSNVVTSYEVNSDNVKEYLNSSNDYETGKNYPFYDYTQAMEASSQNTVETNSDSKKTENSTTDTTNNVANNSINKDSSTSNSTANTNNSTTNSTTTSNKTTTSNLRDVSDSTKTQK